MLRTEVKFNLFRCLSRQRFFASLKELHYGRAHWISKNLSSYHHMNSLLFSVPFLREEGNVKINGRVF